MPKFLFVVCILVVGNLSAQVPEITVQISEGVSMDMVWVGSGSFTMGQSYLVPEHEVTISQGFYIGKYEITNTQWQAIMGMEWITQGPNTAVGDISWYDVDEFINRLNRAEGSRIYRLPTEAEWEYTCQRGVTRNMSERPSELCWDRFGTITDASPRTDPQGPSSLVDNRYGHRVIRGTAQSVGGSGCSARGSISIDETINRAVRFANVGARLVMQTAPIASVFPEFDQDLGSVSSPAGTVVVTPSGTHHELVLVPEGPLTVDWWGVPTDIPLDAFFIDKYEITNAQYRAFLEHTGKTAGYDLPPYWGYIRFSSSQQPVEVSWTTAKDYCMWAGLRLPKEAEWEKAAKGTDDRLYPWGNASPDCGYDIISASNIEGRGCGEERPWPVGSKPAGVSPYGAYNMAGNVWEWVDHRDPNGNPFARGSSWRYSREGVSVRVRQQGWGHVGFRCARSSTVGKDNTALSPTNWGKVKSHHLK